MLVRRAVGVALSVAMVAFAASLSAATAQPVGDDALVAKIKATLNERFPATNIIDVRRAPIDGWFEVFTGDTVVYTDQKADHVLVGSLIDTRTRKDLTADRLDERNSIDFARLPLERAIKTVKGNGARRIAVFSDPDCPFCQQLEQELTGISDVTIYTFLYPIASLHPDAPAKSRAIWCAEKPDIVWSQWMLERKAPVFASCKDDPIQELQALGQQLRINSTPTLFLGNGRRMGGSVPAKELERMLAASDGKAPTPPRS